MASTEEFAIYVMEEQAEEPTAPTERLTIPGLGSPKEIDTEKFKKSYEDILSAVRYMAEKASGVVENYAIDQISMHLGVSAEGGVAFVAKAGIQADIDIIIKRTEREK